MAQLASLPLRSLKLSGYRVLPALLASVAAALPGLRELSLSVARVEGPSSRLDLAGLARLEQLESWELHLLRGPAAAPDITLSPLPPGATALRRLRSVALSHARPAEGEEDAFWGRLSLLPALEALGYVESVHSTRQPPPQLFHLASLTSLSIKVRGAAAVAGAACGFAVAPHALQPLLPSQLLLLPAFLQSAAPVAIRLTATSSWATRRPPPGPSCQSCRTARCRASPACASSASGCWRSPPRGAGAGMGAGRALGRAHLATPPVYSLSR